MKLKHPGRRILGKIHPFEKFKPSGDFLKDITQMQELARKYIDDMRDPRDKVVGSRVILTDSSTLLDCRDLRMRDTAEEGIFERVFIVVEVSEDESYPVPTELPAKELGLTNNLIVVDENDSLARYYTHTNRVVLDDFKPVPDRKDVE